MKQIKFTKWIQSIGFVLPLLFTTPVCMGTTFESNSDNTVTDTTTGLIWQKCSMGQTPDNLCSGTATFAEWSNAMTYCNGLTLAGRTWRLPNINELKSIVDRSKAAGATIDLTVFPATVAGHYWSSSPGVPVTANAWFVFFGNGNARNYNKTNNYYVRCVSTGP